MKVEVKVATVEEAREGGGGDQSGVKSGSIQAVVVVEEELKSQGRSLSVGKPAVKEMFAFEKIPKSVDACFFSTTVLRKPQTCYVP